MSAHTFCQSLALEYPIVKAPMAGGIDQPALVAATCNAGGLGFIGAAYLSPEKLHDDCITLGQLTRKTFAINLFLPEPDIQPPSAQHIEHALHRLHPLHQILGLPQPQQPADPTLPFDALLEVALASNACALSVTFGVPDTQLIKRVHAANMQIFGTATSLDEALLLEQAGVDAIIAQGSEAGGHRGGFLPGTNLTSTLTLVSQLHNHTQLPIIAAGGIMNGMAIRATLQKGASAAALGSAFIPCPESGASQSWKRAILQSSGEQTVLTRAYSGRYARGIENEGIKQLEQHRDALLPFPWQNSLTQTLRSHAKQQDNPDYQSLWAGQGIDQARELPAAVLMQKLIEEAEL